MFFAAILGLPILAGLLAGTFTPNRRAADALAGLCVALGIAGAVALGLDPDTSGGGGSIAFGIGAGLLAAALVYGGWYAGRSALRAVRSA
jgi:hypothetical protein